MELSAERTDRSSDSTSWHAFTASSQPAECVVALGRGEAAAMPDTLPDNQSVGERVVLTVWLWTRRRFGSTRSSMAMSHANREQPLQACQTVSAL